MDEATRATRDDVRTLARQANLDLPDDRLEQLAKSFSAYLVHLNRLHQIEVGDSEPPAITYEDEVR
jgi:Asp-tRNA(Asn)/Glu-tRNA(Gln) amidotransferase C subunit